MENIQLLKVIKTRDHLEEEYFGIDLNIGQKSH